MIRTIFQCERLYYLNTKTTKKFPQQKKTYVEKGNVQNKKLKLKYK
jgi:hypothetical protein